MDESKVAAILLRAIRSRISDVADSVASNSCEDIAEYKFLCGQIQGLKFAEREIIDLANSMKEANDY
jgi:hypothetical protein